MKEVEGGNIICVGTPKCIVIQFAVIKKLQVSRNGSRSLYNLNCSNMCRCLPAFRVIFLSLAVSISGGIQSGEKVTAQ